MRKILLAVSLTLSIVVHAQAPADNFIPNEVQSLRLAVRMKDIQIAQQSLYIAQQGLVNEAEVIHKENGWPPYVVFNLQTMTYINQEPK